MCMACPRAPACVAPGSLADVHCTSARQFFPVRWLSVDLPHPFPEDMRGTQLLWHPLDDIADHQGAYGGYPPPSSGSSLRPRYSTDLSSSRLLGMGLAIIVGVALDSSAWPRVHPPDTCLRLNFADRHAAATRYRR